MKIKLILICLYLCQAIHGQIKPTISQIKGFNKNNGLIENSDLQLEGYVVGDSLPILVTDVKYYLRNSIIPENEYIRIEGSLVNTITANKEKYFGRRVKIKGRIEQSGSSYLSISDTSAVAKTFLSAESNNITVYEKKLKLPKLSVIDINKISNKNALVSPNSNFALLYSGGVDVYNAHYRYYNDLEYMYLTLKYKYGYSDENIIVVYKNGLTVNPQKMMVDFPASRLGLESAINQLSNIMGENRNLFLFVTNHGGGFSAAENKLAGGVTDRNADETDNYKIDETIYYYNEIQSAIIDDIFAEKINGLQLKSLIAVMEPCFSGGFVADLKASKRIVVSAANEFEYSYGSARYSNFDEFSYLFTSALNEAYDNGTTLNADVNSDGVVSIYEAYTFAKNKDEADEHPMLDDNGDGISDHRDGLYSATINLKSTTTMMFSATNR